MRWRSPTFDTSYSERPEIDKDKIDRDPRVITDDDPRSYFYDSDPTDVDLVIPVLDVDDEYYADSTKTTFLDTETDPSSPLLILPATQTRRSIP